MQMYFQRNINFGDLQRTRKDQSSKTIRDENNQIEEQTKRRQQGYSDQYSVP